MTFKPYPIVPFKTGLELDKEPFLIDDDAFPTLTDCYLYQGRIERRLGNKYLGRLVKFIEQVFAGVLNTGAVTYTNTLTNVVISPGSTQIVIFDPNAPTAVIYTFIDDGVGGLSAGVGTSGSINYTTGVFVINFPALPAKLGAALFNVIADYEYFTCLPVMGLPSQETNAINQQNLVAFDTKKANQWNAGTGRFEDISFDTTTAAISWTGTDSDFFWTWNYYVDAAGKKLLWATNFVRADRIRYYNGVTTGGWTVFRPKTATAANWYLDSALLIVSYKDRLIVLNTLETENNVAVEHPQRARWSQNGTPLDVNNSWRDDTAGLGGFIDAPTAEDIISCGFYKDTLLVFFERSTWQLLYTSNESLPFVWQRINTQYGCESTHSVVGFDKGVFAVGDKAIIVSDSLNVERIDQKIPLEVFQIHNESDGPKRVYGIRDYFYQFVYWTFPNSQQNRKYPNRILVLNYLEGSYSFYNDSYTAFGYFQSITDQTWANARFKWNSAGALTWNSSVNQSDFPAMVAGNQQGFVVVLDQQVTNDPTLYITNITQAVQAVVTSPQHNLEVDQYVKFSAVEGMTEINDLVGLIVARSDTTITVDIDSTGFSAYTGNGLMTVLNNISISTKKFNPFYGAGKKLRMNYADFFFEKTDLGALTVDIFVDDSYADPIQTLKISTTQEYGPTSAASKIWNRLYLDCQGQFLQFNIYMSDDQMRDPDTQLEGEPEKSNVVIHALNVWMAESGRLQSYDMR